MTRSIILRSHCSFDKVLNTVKPQHLAYPASSFCCLGCTSAILTRFAAKQQNPEHLSAHSASNTARVKARKKAKTKRMAFCRVTGLGTCPSLAPRTPGRICMPEVQLSLLTFNTSVSLMNNHHVCAITNPRKSAILHFSLQCQKLPPPLGIPEQGLNGPGFSASNICSGRKEATPFFPLELGQIWASKSHADTPRRQKTKQKRETHMDLMGKLQFRRQHVC